MWVVTLTYDLSPGEDDLDRWADALQEIDASVAMTPGRGVDVTLWVQAPEPVKAAAEARDTAYTTMRAEPVAVEVVTEARHEQRAAAPTLPELVASSEAAAILKVSRQRVSQLRRQSTFPKPLVELRTGPVWSRAAIEKFDRTWERRPGRPRLAVRHRS